MPLSRAFLALGSNLGDRLALLRSALRSLEAGGDILVLQSSRIYENRAIGMGEAAPFLNAAVEVRTALCAERLLDRCLQVETGLGRVRTGCWAPRTMDIDVLAFDQITQKNERLELPHPRIAERDFVLRPLLDLEASLSLNGRSVAQMAGQLPDTELKPLPDSLWPYGKVQIIVACSENRVIGRDGCLPWSIPEDWEVFLKKTLGGTLLMGRTSFMEMLKEPSWRVGREYIVLTRQTELAEKYGVRVAQNLREAMQGTAGGERPVWICGGADIYKAALPYSDALHLTQVNALVEGDTEFPDWSRFFTRETASVDSCDDNYRFTFKVLAPPSR